MDVARNRDEWRTGAQSAEEAAEEAAAYAERFLRMIEERGWKPGGWASAFNYGPGPASYERMCAVCKKRIEPFEWHLDFEDQVADGYAGFETRARGQLCLGGLFGARGARVVPEGASMECAGKVWPVEEVEEGLLRDLWREVLEVAVEAYAEGREGRDGEEAAFFADVGLKHELVLGYLGSLLSFGEAEGKRRLWGYGRAMVADNVDMMAEVWGRNVEWGCWGARRTAEAQRALEVWDERTEADLAAYAVGIKPAKR